MKTKWNGNRPVSCEICGRRFGQEDRFFYDFKVRYHTSWALGCETCFKQNGRRLGVGMGQKYSLKTMDKIEARKQPRIPNVKSLAELKFLATEDYRYEHLILAASSNLGRTSDKMQECFDWLMTNAAEAGEKAVIDEVNLLIPIIENTE